MYGYIVAAVMGLLVLGLIVAGMMQTKPGPGERGRLPGRKPVQAETPAADEPTPDRSATANAREIRAAREHTPPA